MRIHSTPLISHMNHMKHPSQEASVLSELQELTALHLALPCGVLQGARDPKLVFVQNSSVVARPGGPKAAHLSTHGKCRGALFGLGLERRVAADATLPSVTFTVAQAQIQ